MIKRHWLMKSEPESYSLEQLKRDRKTLWTGVRNYQARNFMMREMSVGDEILFYHSSAEPTGVVGLARVSGEAVPDPTQFDAEGGHFEPKATVDAPIWFCVEVAFQKQFAACVTLARLRAEKALAKMPLLQRGQRLSVQPVTGTEFAHILKMAGA